MALAVFVVTLAAALYLVQEGFRRANRWVAWGIFLGLPLILTPYWLQTSATGGYPGVGIFPWVKLYTILVGAFWLTALRFTSLGYQRWALGVAFLMLPLNMFEAVAQDLFGRHLAHLLIATSGIMLVVSVPHPFRSIRVEASSPHRDLYYDGMTRGWILGYTLWNWGFVYLNFPTIAAHQMAVLSTALVVGMIEPRRWLQARTFTLAVDMLLLFTFPRYLILLADSSHWTTHYRENFVAGVCLVLVGGYAVRFVVGRGRRLERMVAAEPDAAGVGDLGPGP